MGLMDFFKKPQQAEKKPNAAEYVEWLLVYMLRTSRTEITLNTEKALPGSNISAEHPDHPPCLPEAQMVVNRLKILSEVNPIWKEGFKATGSFERPRPPHTVTVMTQFSDTADNSTCTIKLRVHCRS